jgi:Fe-S-cluster containining protein
MKDKFNKENFQCNRYCGECCKKLSVMVSKDDIKNITDLGYKKEDFLDKDLLTINTFILKRDKDGCFFLKKHKDGKYSCTIHENRPKICRQYPFFGKKNNIESCLPQDMFPNVDFKLKSSSAIK